MQSSGGARANETYHQAEAGRRRANTRREGLGFPSARAALGWYFEASQRLSSPQGMHPRTQTTRTGQEVIVRVDGGRGGDFDEVLATVMTIGVALKNLEGFDERGHRIIMLCVRDGKSQKYTAEALGVSQGLVSRLQGRALDTIWKMLNPSK